VQPAEHIVQNSLVLGHQIRLTSWA
jgi:hypothetical protein